MATNYTKTDGNENFAGLCRIYVDPYRDLMWKVLIDTVPIPTLIMEIQNVLTNAHKRLPFHHQFKRLVDIYSSKSTIEKTDCDISVLYSLFRNIPTGLQPPSRGWGATPGVGDHRITDDIERIHLGRNTVTGHSGTFSISDAEFTAQLTDMVAIVTRIDSSFVPHLMQIKSDCLSSKGHLQHYHIYIEELERQMTVEAELKKRVDDNTRRLDDQDVRIHKLEATNIAAEQKHQDVKRRREQETKQTKKQKKAEKLSADVSELKKYILEKYQTELSKIKCLPCCRAVNVLDIVAPLRMREDLNRWLKMTREEREEAGVPDRAEGEKEIRAYDDLFIKDNKQQREIFLIGEAGIGKTTFCLQLVNTWCRLQTTDPVNKFEEVLKSFEFLFYVQARKSSNPQSLSDMVKEQRCSIPFYKALESVFTSRPERCLIVLDGLDEWRSPAIDHNHLPDTTAIPNSTILITSRPWRIEALQSGLVAESHALEIQGLTQSSMKDLAVKVLASVKKYENPDSEVDNFMAQIHSQNLDEVVQIPLLLIIMIQVWMSGNKTLPVSRCQLYGGLFKSILKKGSQKTELKCTQENKPLPSCLLGKDSCAPYSSLILTLAEFAFNAMFLETMERSLVFSKLDLINQIGEDNLQTCFQLGILSQASFESESDLELLVMVSFPHKTFQEFLCAVYLSGEAGFERGVKIFRDRVTSPVDVFGYKNLLVFLCGMSLTKSQSVFEHMCSVVYNRRYPHRHVHPDRGFLRYRDLKILSKNLLFLRLDLLSTLCIAEAGLQRLLVPFTAGADLEASHTRCTSLFRIPDMYVDTDTSSDELHQFCTNQAQTIKSLVFEDDCITPSSVIPLIRMMRSIEKLGITVSSDKAEETVTNIEVFVSQLQQLKFFSLTVRGNITPNLKDVLLGRIRMFVKGLTDVNTITLAPALSILYVKSRE